MDEKKFALLIDADNISSKYIKIIIDELGKYGTITYKRLYGDLSRTNNRSWKNALLSHSINPVQQYNYTTGKNSTDSAMIIDAMDILYSGKVDGFCLASSDSDFTRLAMRLREAGMTVIGMGESKTPEPFRVSCERFFFLDLLWDDSLNEAESEAEESDKEEDAITPLPALESMIAKIIMNNGIDGTTMDIGELGSRLTKSDPAFDIRNYGYTKFSKFLDQFPSIKLVNRDNSVSAILQETSISLRAIENEVIQILYGVEGHTMNTGQLNQSLCRIYPTFNVQNYGYNRFSKMLTEFGSVKVSSLGRVVTLIDTSAIERIAHKNDKKSDVKKPDGRKKTASDSKAVHKKRS
ncbi:MAG: NYN domain-containing protein [Lachnospiraceae bacterium]|nr:NYN domain-containing protein [Lachnospiraceae bacterium]